MSTRCQIAFYEADEKDLNKFESLIYRHCDGYPKGVLPDITPFLNWFLKVRGWDPEYIAARLLQYLCDNSDKNSERVYAEMRMENPEKGFTGLTGHGICRGFHSDIEYFYAIYPDKIKVFETDFDFGEENKDINDRVKRIKTVKIGKEQDNG